MFKIQLLLFHHYLDSPFILFLFKLEIIIAYNTHIPFVKVSNETLLPLYTLLINVPSRNLIAAKEIYLFKIHYLFFIF